EIKKACQREHQGDRAARRAEFLLQRPDEGAEGVGAAEADEGDGKGAGYHEPAAEQAGGGQRPALGRRHGPSDRGKPRRRPADFAPAAADLSTMASRCRRPHIAAMSNAPQMAEIAALVGDPARANILCALLVGRALTATELALAAGVTPQTASGHLGRLLAARLLVLMKQGRHRYYRLAGPQVAPMLESIMNAALEAPPRFQPRSRLDDQLRQARTCYDHIAGRLGVALADRMTEHELIILGDEAGEVTPAGADLLSRLGVDLSAARARR